MEEHGKAKPIKGRTETEQKQKYREEKQNRSRTAENSEEPPRTVSEQSGTAEKKHRMEQNSE